MLLGQFRKKWRLQRIRLRTNKSALVKSHIGVAMSFNTLLFGYPSAFLSMLSVQNLASSWTVTGRFCEAESIYGFKRGRKIMMGCLTCCGPTKFISNFEGLSTPTTADFELPKILELSWKLHCTTRKSQYRLEKTHQALSGIYINHFHENLCKIWQNLFFCEKIAFLIFRS